MHGHSIWKTLLKSLGKLNSHKKRPSSPSREYILKGIATHHQVYRNTLLTIAFSQAHTLRFITKSGYHTYLGLLSKSEALTCYLENLTTLRKQSSLFIGFRIKCIPA